MTSCLFTLANAKSVPADRENGYAYWLEGVRVDVAGDMATAAHLLFETHLDRHNRIAILDHGR